MISKFLCTLPWVGLESDLPVCTAIDQFKAYETMYKKSAASEQKMVLNMTGCKLPCNYREFQAVGHPIQMKVNGMGFAYGL